MPSQVIGESPKQRDEENMAIEKKKPLVGGFFFLKCRKKSGDEAKAHQY
jgi:hypothetical protein